jgi:hypothetical protein
MYLEPFMEDFLTKYTRPFIEARHALQQKYGKGIFTMAGWTLNLNPKEDAMKEKGPE